MMKDENEWFLQAEYDMETAVSNIVSGRFIHAVFMCHLAVEKALKAVYYKQQQDDPPRTHNLSLLIKRTGIVLPDKLNRFVINLSAVSVPTRYPDQLAEMRKEYNATMAEETIECGKEVLQWLKNLL